MASEIVSKRRYLLAGKEPKRAILRPKHTLEVPMHTRSKPRDETHGQQKHNIRLSLSPSASLKVILTSPLSESESELEEPLTFSVKENPPPSSSSSSFFFFFFFFAFFAFFFFSSSSLLLLLSSLPHARGTQQQASGGREHVDRDMYVSH